MEKYLVSTSTYNELDNLKSLVESIHEYLPNQDILIIDDNSPDGTGELLDQLALKDPYLKAIHRPRKMGLGSAHKLAMKYAIHHGYDGLVTLDADFSHHPKYLPTIVKELQTNDFVIGSRYVTGGRCNYGFIRTAISRSANYLARFLLSLKLHETTTAYRGFRVSLLKRLDIDRLRSNGYSFFVESLYRITKLTDRLSEFPIYFEDRRAGTSKISKWEVLNGIRTLLRLAGSRIKAKTPLRRLPREQSTLHRFSSNCVNCGSAYQSELYPEYREGQLTAATYRCTSDGHRSHPRVAQCLQCGLAYADPQLSEAQINKMYSEVADDDYVKHAKARYRTFQYNLEKIQDLLPKNGKLLDVGAYCGIFLNVAKQHGYEVVGVEPSIWAANYAASQFGHQTYSGTVEELPEELKDLDIVTAWDVLEHVSNPLKELSELQKRMKPGGIFAFSTLNIDNWFPKLMGERWPWLMDMHLYYFKDDVIEDILRKKGFKLIRTQKYCHIISFEYFLDKIEALGLHGVHWINQILKKTPLKHFYLPFRFGDIQLYVAQRV